MVVKENKLGETGVAMRPVPPETEMKPYYQDNHNTIYCLDFRKNELPDESVQSVTTSPPYWGLRKYSGEQELVWGSDKDCRHEWGSTSRKLHSGTNAGAKQVSDRGVFHNDAFTTDNFCSLCGAWKGAYGLEPTPEMYVQHTIEILREIRRVLRKDGVVFLNVGDSYYSSPSNQQGKGNDSSGVGVRGCQPVGRVRLPRHSILKPKDLCLIPFRVAISAQMDGWWVRSVIIWSKPNPMPESVTDRPTESHEYILMLTKSARYYWDQDAVREAHKPETIDRYKYGFKESERDKLGHSHHGKGYQRNDGSPIELNAGRNIRTVWEFPTQPYPEAHFAVFPEKLPELCIKAATPEVGCCSKCGAPWARIVKVNRPDDYDPSVVDGRYAQEARKASGSDGTNRPLSKMFKDSLGSSRDTIGWQPTCKCNADKVPSLVLDPFMGAGTTLWVAKKLNRRAVGYEISQEYCELALERNRQQVLI